jgi:hypothetical protein
MFSKQVLIVAVALGTIAAPAEAQRARWETVSSARVNLGVTSETLRVRGASWARLLRLCVSRRSVAIRDVRIEFERAAPQRVSVRRVIRAGECSLSAPIRLRTDRGRNDQIRSVRIELTRLASGTRPVISLQAR